MRTHPNAAVASCPLRCCALAALAVCGCQYEIVPVSGEVKLNGKPLAGAVVTFQPTGNFKKGSPQPTATGSTGRTDALGHYTLELVHPSRAGAVIGEHTVTISAGISGKSETDPLQGPLLPKAWRDGSKRFFVPEAGTADASFEITSETRSSPAPRVKQRLR